MSWKQAHPVAWMVAATLLFAASSFADLHITLPKRTKPTPVQKLNRDGVKEIQKHNYEKAKKLFYKAYLIDPDDPFTLNNLGYISELEGNIDRAERYYALAADHTSDAQIDVASSSEVKGKAVSQVAGNADDRTLKVNRDNVQAIGLLLKDRAPEADLLLQKALALDPKNPFTLNNIGFAKEKEGELEQALSFYSSAAALGSNERIVVTVNRNWRGKPISEIASDNAAKVRQQLRREDSPEAKVARLNLRGVSALNRNDRKEARECFEQANKIAPENAFTLNNMGYLSELDGDKETADFYYAKAQEARERDARVGVSTRRDMEGRRLAAVADTNDTQVQTRIQTDLERKRQQGGPIQLKHRDNTPVIEPTTPRTPTPQAQSNEAGPQNPLEQSYPRPPSEARPEPAPLGPDLNQPPRPEIEPGQNPPSQAQPLPPAGTAPGTQPQTTPMQQPVTQPPATSPNTVPPANTMPGTSSQPPLSQPENGKQPPNSTPNGTQSPQ
jgi:Flp pilus assembly protein TadD